MPYVSAAWNHQYLGGVDVNTHLSLLLLAAAIACTITGCTLSPSNEADTSTEAVETTVDYVIDGDTLGATVDGDPERVRLLGIDTPELGRDGNADEECAREAKQFLDDWITGETVSLSTDPNSPTRDRYDRLLAYVDIDETDVSRVMLDGGWADLYTANSNLLRWDTYVAAADSPSRPRCAPTGTESRSSD